MSVHINNIKTDTQKFGTAFHYQHFACGNSASVVTTTLDYCPDDSTWSRVKLRFSVESKRNYNKVDLKFISTQL